MKKLINTSLVFVLLLLSTITFAREYKIGETFSPDQIESYSSFDEIGIIFNDDEGIGKRNSLRSESYSK